jgi:hypothetical protein
LGGTVLSQLRFGLFAGLLGLVGVYFLWPASLSTGSESFPRWLAYAEAGLCAAVAAIFVGDQFARHKASRWTYSIAALLALCLALLLLAYVFVFSYEAFFRKSSPLDFGDLLLRPLILWFSWSVIFTVGAVSIPIVAVLDIVAIAGAVTLIRPAQAAPPPDQERL